MSLKPLQKYLVFTGVLFNIALGYSVYYFAKGVANFGTLPNVFYLSANKLSHPMIRPVSNTLQSLGEFLDNPKYYWKEFSAKDWPSVGPDYTNSPSPFYKPENTLFVSTDKELTSALRKVQPGQTIVIEDGEYKLKGKKVKISKVNPPDDLPIMVTARNPGNVTLVMSTYEGIYIDRPNWKFSGIRFKGKCGSDNSCEHAMHIVGNAQNIEITNNEFIDFNAAIKTNVGGNHYPDNGIIRNNHFYFTRPRKTKLSVTPINIDHASNWKVSRNIIRDFIKLEGNRISYGAFMKGGVTGGLFENNLVICNTKQRRYPGYSIGLSIGGGGMASRRNGVTFEGENVIVRNNIILHCNDVGIYVNQGANSLINNNTLYNTNGIDVRFPDSSAVLVNNLMSGQIRVRDNAQVILEAGNYIEPRSFFTNKEHLNDIFLSPEIGNLKIVDKADELAQTAQPYPLDKLFTTDFCGESINQKSHFVGAYSEYNGCFSAGNR